MKFKESFIEFHRDLLGEDLNRFLEWCEKPLRKSIRVNTSKIKTTDLLKRFEGYNIKTTAVPWCGEGFFVDTTETDMSLGATLEHQLGYFYIQEAASMIPVIASDPKTGDKILDLCAAPGSKATQAAPLCHTLVANEPQYSRLKALSANVMRMGLRNVVLTTYKGQKFPREADESFDKIIVDAPCSDVGVLRKNYKIMKTWSPKRVRLLAHLQKKLISRAFELLNPGGTLVYSTCTSSTEENEEVVLDLLERNGNAELAKIDLPVKAGTGMLEGTEKCMRIWPWLNDTEMFFVAKIRKK